MERTSVQESVQSLKWFLIRRFLMIMLFIFISEELLNAFYRLYLVPFLQKILDLEILTVRTDEGNILMLLFEIVAILLLSFLPDNISGILQSVFGIKINAGFGVYITSPLLKGQPQFVVSLYRIAVIFIFGVLLLIALLPYVISAYWYYGSVSSKVAELLKAQEEQKAEYDRQRSLLLSDIAHDIKTPVTTVCGYARALADDVVADENKRKDYLKAIYNKSLRVDELINLLFEYVKLDSSGFKLHKENADLCELLRENIALIYSDFEEKKIQPDINIPEKEILFEMDRVQLGRAVTNILTNAVKYGAENTKVKISLYENAQAVFPVKIVIADNAASIDDELAAHIFEPFSRGDKARSSMGGSGLGLSIAYKIVKMHGGELTLERKCNDGYAKAFVITLPKR